MRPALNRFIFALLVLFATASFVKAEWRSDIGVFRIGIVTDVQPSAFRQRSEPFRRALQDVLNMDVEFFISKRPESIIDALSSDRIEYAVLSATGYALAWSVCECIEPVSSPRSADGTDGYNLVLLSQPNGPADLKGLSGKNIVLLSAEDSLETIIFKTALEEAGVSLGDVNFTTFDSGESALSSFIDGQHDALLGWSSLTGNPSTGYTRGTLHMIARRTDELATRYPMLWKSDQLPHRVHLVRKKLHGEPKNLLRNLLASMFDRNPVAYDSIEPIYGGGFTTSRHSRYKPLIDAIKVLQYRGSEENVAIPEAPSISQTLRATENAENPPQ